MSCQFFWFHHKTRRPPAGFGWGCWQTRRRTRDKVLGKERGQAYHSPPGAPSPLRLEESWMLPAAAEAKLEGSGVGIMEEEDSWLRRERQGRVQQIR